MSKKILNLSANILLSVSMLLLPSITFAATPNKTAVQSNLLSGTAIKQPSVLPVAKKAVKTVQFAKVRSVELNYNTLSITMSYIPVYNTSFTGKVFNLTIPNVSSTLNGRIGLPTLNSNSVANASYTFIKHVLSVRIVLRNRIQKSQVHIMSEGHILVVKFPSSQNRPIISKQLFPKPPAMINKSSYSVKNSKTVYVSLKNITMITTPFPIKRIVYSKDQNIEMSKSLDTAFVKILPLEEQKPSGRIKYLYNDKPRDIYIITAAGTYSLNLVPRNIPSLTLMLHNPQIPNSGMSAGKTAFKQPVFNQPQAKTGLNTNFASFNAPANITNLVGLIKDAYLFKIPSGYSSYALKKTYNFNQVFIRGLNAWVGGNFAILIYQVTAKQPVNLTEKEFLWMSPNPVAISIANPVLNKGEKTRIFIVEGK